jgi:mannose-6-phosphate isomerase-like protein (cupin superfamily)
MFTVKELEQDYEHLADLEPEALRDALLKAHVNYSRASLELHERRGEGRIHLPASEARLGEKPPPFQTIIAPELGFNIHNFHLFTSGRDARSDRYHSHGDALKYYIYGSGIEDVNGQRFEVKAGDFMHIPANTWHGTINPHDEPLVFLAAQQFPGTWRQTPTPFLRQRDRDHEPLQAPEIQEHELSGLEGRALYYDRYMLAEMEFGRVAVEVDRRRRAKRLYVPAEEAPLMEWGPGRRAIIAPELGFDIYTFSLSFECLAANTNSSERTSGDTVKYYLAGKGVERVGDRRVEVEAGDFVQVPANTWHATENPYDAPLRLLCWEQIPGTYTQVPTAFLSR